MADRIRVGTLVELAAGGVKVVQAGERPVAVFLDGGKPYAVDNRCPHMGFPLARGTVKDCVLTCHWHQARFDLASGGTFDLFADDIPAFDTTIEDGVVFVSPEPREKPDAEWHRRRLRKGLEHNIGLITAKSLAGLLDQPGAEGALLRETVEFAAARSEGFGQGLTMLTIVANLRAHLAAETTYLALARSLAQVAADCDGTPPRRILAPLDAGRHDQPKLASWFAFANTGRARDGALRVLETSLAQHATDAELTAMLAGADADRIYQAIGHPFDSVNKAIELSTKAGADLRGRLLPLTVGGIVASRGQEESAGWHHPIELVEPLRAAEGRIAERMKTGTGKTWAGDAALRKTLWSDDPLAIIAGIDAALGGGASPAELARRVALTAALRLARFAPSNEVGDWFNPQHTFIYANAVWRCVSRSPEPAVIRAVYHAALAVYMDRFLNVPAAPLPDRVDDLAKEADALRSGLLESLDGRSDPALAPRLVARWLRLDHPRAALIDTLTLATVREDLDFHPWQVLEAGVAQAESWKTGPEVEQIYCGVVRQLAAFCPTRRAGLQTATIARRLHRGEKMYEDGE